MSEMIERVAKAIFETWADAEGSETTWDALIQMQRMDGYANSKKHYKMAFDEARAAIEAMREPTEEMIEKGSDARRPGNSRWGNSHGTWKAMIDVALK